MANAACAMMEAAGVLYLRVHSGGALEERVVAGHREVDARTCKRPGVDAGGQAHDRDDRHDVSGTHTQQPVGNDVQHAPLHSRELANRDDVEVEHVEQEVDDGDDGRSQKQRARHVASGIADLLRHVRGGVPARIGEHDRDEREEPAR